MSIYKVLCLFVCCVFCLPSFKAHAYTKPDSIHSKYLQFHEDYLQDQKPLNYQYLYYHGDGIEDLAFTLDTVVLYSVYNNPKRITYTYTEEGYILSAFSEFFTNDAWTPASLKSSVFDSAGNETLVTWQAWSNNEWQNTTQITNTYTLNKKLSNSLRQVWDGGEWQNNAEEAYVYDASGNLLSLLTQTWDGSEWVNNSHEQYIYNETGMLITAIGEIWDDSLWVNDQQHTYTYDANGNMSSWVAENWDSTDWINAYKEIYEYDASNKRISTTTENWIESSWVSSFKTVYAYNSQDYVLAMTILSWDGTDWVEFQRRDFTYDTYGGIETEINSSWDSGNWLNDSYKQNTFDGFGNVVKGQYFVWDGQTWVQEEDGPIQIFFDYSTHYQNYTAYRAEASFTSLFVGKNEVQKDTQKQISCWPNPAVDKTTIQIDVPQNCSLNIHVYSVIGKKVKDMGNFHLEKGVNTMELNIRDLPAGLYTIYFNSKFRKESTKLLINR